MVIPPFSITHKSRIRLQEPPFAWERFLRSPNEGIIQGCYFSRMIRCIWCDELLDKVLILDSLDERFRAE